MASWYSNLLTKTTSQISNLRTTLLSSEADGDTEDDTHVCRVLRNYYSEKGRPFPPWLPPDPRAPAQPVVQPLYAQAGGHPGGRLAPPGQQQQQQQQVGGGGLSSLWDNNAGAQQQQVPQSLRAGGGGRGMMQRPGPSPVPGGADDRSASGRGGAGSYQSASRENTPSGGASAQDRLRQRLWGGRTASPQGAQSPFQPPAGGGGGGGGNYDDRFAPGGSYDTGRGGGGGGPQMGAHAPWSGGGDDYYGGGGGAGGGRQPPPGGRRPGLPSGPRGYR